MKKKIESGVYLVVDSSYGEGKVLSVAKEAMAAGLDVLQLWASWKDDRAAAELGRKLARLASDFSVPFVVNNDLEIAIKIGADGVHIDGYDPSPDLVRSKMGSKSIVGVTCSTKMEKVMWADAQNVDYISFCSMFPSTSVDECDIVPLEMLGQARGKTSVPIFASGGINLDNAEKVVAAGADGLAVISAIMAAPDPANATTKLKEIVTRSRKEIAVSQK
jgi:thiamine-phosphate pyrophosphorylase